MRKDDGRNRFGAQCRPCWTHAAERRPGALAMRDSNHSSLCGFLKKLAAGPVAAHQEPSSDLRPITGHSEIASREPVSSKRPLDPRLSEPNGSARLAIASRPPLANISPAIIPDIRRVIAGAPLRLRRNARFGLMWTASGCVVTRSQSATKRRSEAFHTGQAGVMEPPGCRVGTPAETAIGPQWIGIV